MVLECRKLLKQKEDMGQGDDRISQLPDILLHHILSFLEIKCVIRTSILSKRWKNVWDTVPDLDFQEWLSPTTKDIHLEAQMNIMDRMLFHHGTLDDILLKTSEDMGQGEDRISELPDFLLHHILSFMKIKGVVRTSILSKRWRNVWVTIPNLDFREWLSPSTKDNQLETKRFMNFMDRMLLHRGTPNNIHKFALECKGFLDASRVNAWISTVIDWKVEVLILCGSLIEPFFIPLSLFTCGSLTKLSLRIDTKFNFSLPKSISFPRLKYLELYSVTFKDEYLTEQLFTNPVLEELRLKNCFWEDMKIVCISAPALKVLEIEDCEITGFISFDGLDSCEVKIHAPTLQTLTYKGSVANAYNLSSFPSLNSADIDLVFGKSHHELGLEETGFGSTAINLLGELSNVKVLHINETFETLSLADSLLSNLPTFHNLIHFHMSSVHKTLFLLLRKVPNLELLHFHQGDALSADNEDFDDWMLNMVHCSLFLHLKEVRFERFGGREIEMDVVKLILWNAGVLVTMTIIFTPYLSLNNKRIVMEQLLSLPRKSVDCVIKFSPGPFAE